MPVYRSPEGVLYNLDKFVSYEVTSDGYRSTDGALFKLVGQTETGSKVTIYSDKSHESEVKCNTELAKIHESLSRRASVSVVLDAETRQSLCDIRSELEALRQQIGKEN